MHPLLVIDEVGYIPFEPEAANLFFQLVSSRYERASLIVTSNKPFGRWGEVFGDDVVAAAMIDRLVHHAKVINLRGDSYRLKDRDLGRVPTATTDDQRPCPTRQHWILFTRRYRDTFQPPLTVMRSPRPCGLRWARGQCPAGPAVGRPHPSNTTVATTCPSVPGMPPLERGASRHLCCPWVETPQQQDLVELVCRLGEVVREWCRPSDARR